MMIDNKISSNGEGLILYASGSNSHGQLGVIINNEEDIQSFEKCYEWISDIRCHQDDHYDISQDEKQQEESRFSISSALGGRHSLFVVKSLYHNGTRSYSSLCFCGDSSQGQVTTNQAADSSSTSKNDICIKPLSLCSSSSTSSQKEFKPFDSNVNIQNYRRETLKKLNYKNFISTVSNINEDLKRKLLHSYQPVQVAACWETSFIVLSHFNTHVGQSTNGISNDDIDKIEGIEESNGHDDYIIALGSHDFDLRGSKNPLEDPMNPNLVDFPKSSSTSKTRQKIKLFSGCKHLIAMIQHVDEDGYCIKIELVGWGAARHGQLGPIANYPKLPRSIKPTFLSISIPTMLDHSSIKIALGNQHTVIVCPTRIWCWGNNRNHQIPPQLQKLEPNGILELQASWNATFVLTSTDRPGFTKLLAYGNNSYGQLGVEDKSISYAERLIESSYSRLCAGSEHVLIRKGDRQVWGWGWNEHGNLGQEYGDELQHSRPFGLIYQTLEDQRVAHVAAGCATSFIFCERIKPI